MKREEERKSQDQIAGVGAWGGNNDRKKEKDEQVKK